MGLAVVFGIIQEHKGAINVYSEPGQGTTFHVYLPVIETAAAPISSNGRESVSSLGSGHILLVDDEKELIWAHQALLENLGYTVTAFDDPLAACTAYEESPDGFDLVMTDMTMPGMTGMALSQRILRTTPSQPIVLCTGHSELINREKALAMGIAAYVEKPVMMKDLAKIIREILDRP